MASRPEHRGPPDLVGRCKYDDTLIHASHDSFYALQFYNEEEAKKYTVKLVKCQSNSCILSLILNVDCQFSYDTNPNANG